MPEDSSLRSPCCAAHHHGEISPDVACERRRCTVCGHEACPCCGDWCDVLVPEYGPCFKTDPNDVDYDLCCDGACTYDASSSPIEPRRLTLVP